jgi:hypothetical protein
MAYLGTKPANAVLTSEQIGDGVVATADLADGAITKSKMASNGAWSPAGTVLQVVNATYSVQTDFSTASYVDTGLTATITPSSANSKILVLVNQIGIFRTAGTPYGVLRLVRGATQITIFGGEFTAVDGGGLSSAYLDSPATTSATTYKTQIFASGATMQLQRNSGSSSICLLEIAG